MPTIRASIAASELLTRLRECQVELWVANGSLRYRAPTGAFTPELRACVASLRTEITTLLTEQVAEPLPLSPVQQRLWFEAQLAPMSAAYNIPAAVRMRGPLDLAALEWSLQEVVRRHEALRTTFEVGEDGLPRQKVLPSLAVSLAVVDMSGQSEARLAAERWVELPFDLCRDALIRCRLFRLSANEHVFCVCVHHRSTTRRCRTAHSRARRRMRCISGVVFMYLTNSLRDAWRPDDNALRVIDPRRALYARAPYDL